MRADPANVTRSRAVSVSSPSSGAPAPPSPRRGARLSLHYQKREYPHATLRNYRHELRGLRKPCGKKAVAAVPGVASVAVSLLTNSMQVDYAPDADPDATARRILRAVDAAGYGASLASAESESAELEDTETPKLKKGA